MKKDRIASVILICLVVSSVFLTVEIWFSEELWPDGYNSFINPQNILSRLPFVGDNAGDTEAVAPLHETMFMPERIIATESISKRAVYSGNNDQFIALNDFAKTLLRQLFLTEDPEKENISAVDYCDTIKGNAFLVEYPAKLPVKVLGHICEVNDSPVFSDVSAVSRYIAVPGDNCCYIYMYDEASGDFIKYTVSFDNTVLYTVISEHAIFGSNFMTAYELGFYKRDDVNIEQKLTFSPFVIIDTSNTETESMVISGINPFDRLDSPSSLSLEAIGGIVSSFGYNHNTIRRYTDKDGTLVLVEDYSTIKIYPSGILEFTTTTPKKGINMQINSGSSASPQNILDTVDSLTEILSGIWQAMEMDNLPDIRLSSDITDNYSDYSLSLDYRYGEYPVILSYGDMGHAIELKIKDNLLVSLKVCIREYISTGEFSENLSTTDALDKFFEHPDVSPDAENLFLGYIDYGTAGSIYTYWNVLDPDGKIFSLR